MNLRTKAALLATLAFGACGTPGKKPSDADVAAYLGQSEPGYLRISGVTTTFEPASGLAGQKAPQGSWRVKVDYVVHSQQDLYGPAPEARSLREAFDTAVSRFEGFRVARIAAVERAGIQAGLMKKGDAAPEPAVPVVVVTHAGQDVADHVTLLAQPDGAAWKFFQLDAQAVSDVGAPLADLKAANPHLVFVMAGSDEDRSYRDRAGRLMTALAKTGGP